MIEDKLAYRSRAYNEQGAPDTGWGLIYRLNILMNQIETSIVRGDYDHWNMHLDSLFRNIMFKSGKTKDYWSEMVSYRRKIEDLNNKIREAKLKEDPNIKIYLNELWGVIYKKDIWLRQVMYEMGLYLKQPEYDPSKREIYQT